MPPLISLISRKFGRLRVLRRASNSSYGDVRWLCLCECGAEKPVVAYTLTSGQTSSCGCLRRELVGKRASIHGESKLTAEYSIWTGIKNRCYNKKQENYPRYGGQGVRMARDWKKSYIAFRDYLEGTIGRRPSKNHSLDRINANGNYQPGNIRWATASEQRRNRRNK